MLLTQNTNSVSEDQNQKLSTQIDVYIDKSRKSIQQWTQEYINADLRIYNGTQVLPLKKGLQDIYTYAMLDTHLSAVIDQRKSKVLGEKFGIYSKGTIDDNKTDLLSKKWFNDFVGAVLDSKFYGYNCIELQDLVSGQIQSIKTINRGNVIPELKSVLRNPYNPYQGFALEGRPDEDYYILVDTGNLGILNKIVPLTILKRVTLSYWGEHTETFSTPIAVLKTENKDKLDSFNQQLTNFVRNRKIIISNEDNFQVIANGNGDVFQIYRQLIEQCNAEISKAIIGQTMTTDNGSSKSQAEVHENVLEEISEGDREFVENIVNDLLIPKLINLGYAFGKDDKFRYVVREKRSYADKLETIKTLKENGFTTAPENIKDYLDLPFQVEISQVTDNTITNSLKKKVRT
jgi:phage gp29-like protein